MSNVIVWTRRPIALLAISIGACAGTAEPSGPATQPAAHFVSPETVAMRPFLGAWSIDLPATLAANPQLSDAEKTRLRDEFTYSEVEFELTRDLYISRSWIKTITDRYTVVEVIEPGLVIIKLSPSSIGETRGTSNRKLRLRDGRLFLEYGAILFVWKRPPVP